MDNSTTYSGKPFPDALRDIMDERAMSQLQLSYKAGVHQTSISRYLSGEQSPSVETVELIAKALQVSPLYFSEYRRYQMHLELDALIDEDDALAELLLRRLRKDIQNGQA